jgi:hypothetical protein
MMMGLAIAHHIREQVVFINEPINVNPKYHFNVERERATQYDWGTEIVPI